MAGNKDTKKSAPEAPEVVTGEAGAQDAVLAADNSAAVLAKLTELLERVEDSEARNQVLTEKLDAQAAQHEARTADLISEFKAQAELVAQAAPRPDLPGDLDGIRAEIAMLRKMQGGALPVGVGSPLPPGHDGGPYFATMPFSIGRKARGDGQPTVTIEAGELVPEWCPQAIVEKRLEADGLFDTEDGRRKFKPERDVDISLLTPAPGVAVKGSKVKRVDHDEDEGEEFVSEKEVSLK